MKEIYKRRYVNDNIVEENIIFSSEDDDKITTFLINFAKKNNYIKFGKILVNQQDKDIIILLGNEKGLI